MALFGWLILVGLSLYITIICVFISLFGGEEFSRAKGYLLIFTFSMPIFSWWLVYYTAHFTLTLL